MSEDPFRDPVCGMEVDDKAARYMSLYMGEIYYFCSPLCKEKFDESPQRFTATAGRTCC